MSKLGFKISVFCAALALVTFSTSASYSAPPPGCDSQVLDTTRNYAEAKVAYEVAAVDGSLEKPPSALRLTCFYDSMIKSMEKSSLIFSGNFSDLVKDTLKRSLDAHYANFADDDDKSSGSGSGVCDKLAKYVQKQGTTIAKDIPSFEEAISGVATGDKRFKDSWDATKGKSTVKDYEQGKEDLENQYSYMTFTKGDSPCKVMKISGFSDIDCSSEE